MPGGKVHTALTLATLSGVVAPYLVVNLYGNEYLYAGGVVAGLLVTPDLDIDKGNFSDTILRRVSLPAQLFWRVAWTPYGKAIPHRSHLSHFPFLGTLLRIGYIFLVINIINGLAFFIMHSFGLVDTVSIAWLWDWSFFFGLCHADIIHWAVDNTIKGKDTFEEQ